MAVTSVVIPETHGRPYRLGRHVGHDDRNLAYRTTFRTPAYTDKVWPDSAPVLNQAAVGSCTGETVADIINTEFFAPVRNKGNAARDANGFLTQADAYGFYHQATVNNANGDPSQIWQPNDVGSTGPAAAQAGVQAGFFDRYQHCFTFEEFQATLEQQPVMLGTAWTNDMFRYDASGVVTVGSLDPSNIGGGHEYMARAILYTKGLVLCRNHWYAEDNVTPWNPLNDGVKLPGEFYIKLTDIPALLAQQGDVTVPHGVGMP